MENFNNHRDLERFVRGKLQNLPSQADESVWDQLATIQQKRNVWLKWRPYLLPAAAMLAILVMVAWLSWPGDTTRHSTPGTNPAPDATAPVANQPIPAENLFTPAADISPNQAALAARPWINQAPQRPDWYARNTVPAAQMQFLAEQGVRYRNPASGNTVEIPGGVLIYPDGSAVHGPVTLLFREYRSIPDFLAAGMPMHFANENGSFFFNSGGMFEVRAMQQGVDLAIAPGKAYTVNFTPTHELQDASFFQLSDTTDTWAHLPELAPLRVVNEAAAARDNQRGDRNLCLPDQLMIPHTTDRLAWMRSAIQTGCAWARGTVEPPRWFRQRPSQSDEFYMKALERSDIRLRRESDAEQRFFPDDYNGVFTELAVFKNCYFVRRTDSTNVGWRPDREHTADGIYYQDRAWKSVYIRSEGGPNCAVIVTDGSADGIELPARLVRSNEAGLAQSEFDPAALLAEYQRRREKRHADNLQAIHRWRTFIQMADLFQSNAEYCLSSSEWFDYFEKNRPAMQHRYDSLQATALMTDGELVNTLIDKWMIQVATLHRDRWRKNQAIAGDMGLALRVTGFGTFNCDQIFQLAQRIEYVRPRYVTLGGETIAPVSTRVVDRERRLFFSMPSNDAMLKLPGRPLDVVVIDKRGRTYYLAAQDYATTEFATANNHTFTVREVSDQVSSPMEWARLLGI